MTTPTSATKPTDLTVLRVPVPREWSIALDHLALDAGRSKQDLLGEAVLLLLRYFDRGAELRDLDLPNKKNDQTK